MSHSYTEVETEPFRNLQGPPSALMLHPSPPERPSRDDEFKYGWRDVKKVEPDGTTRWVQAPLTREDLLHPQEGDHENHSSIHQEIGNDLYGFFTAQLHSDPTAVVFRNSGIYWDDPVLRHSSPDVTVILGVKKHREWTEFHVGKEGVRPALIVEVTSPQAMDIDLVDKRRIYEQAMVPLYIIVEMDAERGTRPVRLIGYQLTAKGYVEMEANERGWLWMDPVKLFIGIRGEDLECYERTGERMRSYAELVADLAAMRGARIAIEQAAAEARVEASETPAGELNEELRS